MIILGLGSNLNFPLANLREAIRHLKAQSEIKIKRISPVYISDAQLPENPPDNWHKSYLNIAITCETHLPPLQLLKALQAIEIAMGRQRKERWAPRNIDIDILAFGNENYQDHELIVPHAQLFNRPFALLPLLDVYPDWQHPHLSKVSWLNTEKKPFNTRKIAHSVNTSALMGIVNITPDSFSDDGQLQTYEAALEHIRQLIHAGAEIIDIGAESTRPNATLLTPEQEWQRLEPILMALKNLGLDSAIMPQISIDTRQANTVEKALTYPIQIINDVSGTESQEIAKLLANTSIRYVTTHNLGVPPTNDALLPEDCDPIDAIYEWAKNRIEELQNHGLKKSQIIIDVGIGFGKTLKQNWQLIQQAQRFQSLGVPILYGHSRKSFLKEYATATADRDLATCIIANHLSQQNVDYIRLHNVRMMKEFFAISQRITESLV